MNLRKEIVRTLHGIAGYHTRRRLIIFLSDDWGTIRVSSKINRKKLVEQGFDMDSNRFDRFDNLESNTDMEMLFEVLKKYKDKNNNHPIISAVTNVANPDFFKIKEDNFKTYYYNDFISSHSQFENHEKVHSYYLEGIERRIFIPQFHGREHLNIAHWLNSLQSGDIKTLQAFDFSYFMFNSKDEEGKKSFDFGAAYNIMNPHELAEQNNIISDGLNIFYKTFGIEAKYFQAPCEIFNDELNFVLKEGGIELIDVPKIRKMPIGNNRYKLRLHYLGQTNKTGHRYITRNAVFEPNLYNRSNCVNECLSDIRSAFSFNNPAIISNHRASFMGEIDPANRAKGLHALNELLSRILKEWPDVEFIEVKDIFHKAE